MAHRLDSLRKAAIAIVAQGQPCTANDLANRLQQGYGASHGEANRILLELSRDGPIRRTCLGELVMPGGGRGWPELGKLIVHVVFMLPVIAFIAWVFYQLFWGASAGPPPGFPGAG